MVWKRKELRLGTQLFNDAWIEGKKTVRTKLAWAMQEDLCEKKIKQTIPVRHLNSIPGPGTSFTRTGAVPKSFRLWLAAYETGVMSSSLPDAGGWKQTCQQCSCPGTLCSSFLLCQSSQWEPASSDQQLPLQGCFTQDYIIHIQAISEVDD